MSGLILITESRYQERTDGRIQAKLEIYSELYRNQPESAPALRPSSSRESSWLCSL